MAPGNAVAFAIAVLAACMAAATHVASGGGGSCENYERNVMLYVTTGALLMFAVATFASQFRIPWHASLLSAIALIGATIAIMSTEDPVQQHAAYFAIACLMGVVLIDVTRRSPFLDGSLVLAVILFASVTAMVMRYGDRVGARATSAGIFAYFCMVVLYLAYLVAVIASGAQVSSTAVIAAHLAFLALGCFLTLRALRAMETQRAACKSKGAQYPVTAVRLLIRLFSTISNTKAISRAR
jgi:hypothetical protein